jgi:hypothetical protein
MKLIFFILAVGLSFTVFAQVTTTKPPGPDDQIETEIEISKEIDQFLIMVKERALSYQTTKIDFTNINFLSFSSYVFLENSISPPQKNCCNESYKLSPSLMHILTPQVLEKLESITHNKESYIKFLVNELKVNRLDAEKNYQGYRDILNLEIAR